MLSPEDSQSSQAIFKDLKVDQFPHSHEDYWITKDAARRLISWSDTALTDDKGEVACIVSAGIDITEHEEGEEADRQSAEYFRSLVENAADALLILDKDGVIRFENPSFEKILGYKPEEFLDKNLRELVHPDDGLILSKALEGVKRKPDSTASMQLRLQSMEGSWVTVQGVTKNFLTDPAVSGIAVTVRDITRRKKAEQGIQRQLKTLDALHAIDSATSSGLDLQVTAKVILEQLTQELEVDAASVLLFHPNTHKLKYFSGLGFRNIDIARSEINLGEGVAGKAGLERELIRIPDLRDSEEASRRAELLAEEEFVAYYAMPLVARGELKGVLEIFNRSALSPDQDWLDLLSAVASQAAVAMDNADLIAGLQNHNTGLSFAYDYTLEKVSYALDLREQLSHGHSQRLAEWTLKLGEAMGMEGPDLINDRRGALLHDIGKIGVPESILLKPGPLSEDEWEVVQKHPRYAYLLLSEIPYLRAAANIPYCHHEKWNGSGYPRGLKGKEIPLAARVFSVLEVWDVMGCDRPYREALPNMQIREYLKSHSGIDFDPEIVERFLEMEREGAFTRDPPSESVLTQDEAPEDKGTDAEPPQEMATSEPRGEVTEKPQEEVTGEPKEEEPKGTVLGKLKGKVTETLKGKVSEESEETVTETSQVDESQGTEPKEILSPEEPAEVDLTLKETDPEPKAILSLEKPKEADLKPKETISPEKHGEVDRTLKEKASTEEPQESGLKFKDPVNPEKPQETDLKPEEKVSTEEPQETSLKFKEPASPEKPRETGLKLEEKASLVKPTATGLKPEEKAIPEKPNEPDLRLGEKISPVEVKGTNSGAPPLIFNEPLMESVTQELEETTGDGKVTERLMGRVTQEPPETEEEGKDTSSPDSA